VSDAGRGIDQIWRDYSRKATDLQLAALAALIVPVILALAWGASREAAPPSWWPVILIPAFLSAFGSWGIGDRELHANEVDRSRLATACWRLVRGISVLLAVLCVIAAVGLFMHYTLGTWTL
jgi:succinate dehydrogenase hydrophobic anchor subunit